MLVLSGYQLIEASLKLYIVNYFRIAKYYISDRIHFGFDGSDYHDAPLGQLVKVFSKTCADKELVADLKSEISHRNHVAHKATLVLYKKDTVTSEEFDNLIKDIQMHGEKITNLLSRLKKVHSELNAPFDK
ncbi:hypothetical protein GBN26_02100 [Plesiomonas shigelloides]|uniref:hypothetical protein n=1 Tax=Plesiomonas shigelloides TaxID=703 RepID=UPI001262A341|nr:hypothetical protein [Plesiomonas shigelloides]KAB7703183.1 hypothetical protein GBN26_02100 [Plesiomonas shigelloides]